MEPGKRHAKVDWLVSYDPDVHEWRTLGFGVYFWSVLLGCTLESRFACTGGYVKLLTGAGVACITAAWVIPVASSVQTPASNPRLAFVDWIPLVTLTAG